MGIRDRIKRRLPIIGAGSGAGGSMPSSSDAAEAPPTKAARVDDPTSDAEALQELEKAAVRESWLKNLHFPLPGQVEPCSTELCLDGRLITARDEEP